MTTSTDGAPPSVAPEPDGGSGPAGDSSLRRPRERPERDENDDGVDSGPGWLREEIQRRIAEGRSRSGGRHARRDSVSPGSIGYVPRHSVATPGPGAPPPGPVGGSPSPHASELLRRERTEADRTEPAPAAWSGPLGAPAEAPASETNGTAPAAAAPAVPTADPAADQRPEAPAPPDRPRPAGPPVRPPSPSPRPRPAPAAPQPPVDPAAQAAPDGSATGPDTAQQAAAAATAPDVVPAPSEPIPQPAPDETPGAAPPAAETAPVPTRPRPGRPSPGPTWIGEPPSSAHAPAQPPVAPVPPAPEPAAAEEPAAGPPPAAEPSAAEPSAVQATAPTAPVVAGRPVLGDPVFTARTPQPGSREWDVVDPVRVPEQRGADDPDDLQSRRVRVVLAERRGVARPVRTVVDIQEGTGVGEFLRNDLIKTQLSIALRFATGAAVTLGLLPLLFAMVPAIGQIELIGIRLPWLVLGLLVYPFLFGIGLWYSRLAEKVEQSFADHVQD